MGKMVGFTPRRDGNGRGEEKEEPLAGILSWVPTLGKAVEPVRSSRAAVIEGREAKDIVDAPGQEKKEEVLKKARAEAEAEEAAKEDGEEERKREEDERGEFCL